MKHGKKYGTKKTTTTPEIITENVGANGHGISNVWVRPMFVFSPKVGNNKEFKELSAGAEKFAALILQLTPPGEKQKVALDQLNESFMNAGYAIARSVGATI